MSKSKDSFLTVSIEDLVHPMIHLGCGLEFNQPNLVAEALAAACVHNNWPKTLLIPTEDYVRSDREVQSKSLLQVLQSLRDDTKITSAVKASDPFNKIPDGLLTRIGAKELTPYLSQFQVKPTEEDVQRKMSEMMHTVAYMTAAAQNPDKVEALDFVLVHAVTLSVFYPAILGQEWLTIDEKARLIESKGRFDAVLYAGCGCPPLYPERIINYKPRHPNHGWPELFHRSNVYYDEGHVTKLMRALFALENLKDTGADLPITKEHFSKIAHMAVDSVERALEAGGNTMPDRVKAGVAQNVGIGGDMVVGNMIRWVFYGGLENTWQYVPNLKISAH
jgi:oxidoreductase AflY